MSTGNKQPSSSPESQYQPHIIGSPGRGVIDVIQRERDNKVRGVSGVSKRGVSKRNISKNSRILNVHNRRTLGLLAGVFFLHGFTTTMIAERIAVPIVVSIAIFIIISRHIIAKRNTHNHDTHQKNHIYNALLIILPVLITVYSVITLLVVLFYIIAGGIMLSWGTSITAVAAALLIIIFKDYIRDVLSGVAQPMQLIMYPEQFSTHSETIHHQWSKVLSGTKITDAGFSNSEVPMVLGALGEARTVKILHRDLPEHFSRTGHTTLINGLGITNKSGDKESADIDHLLITEKLGHVMIDTKVFRDAPVCSPIHNYPTSQKKIAPQTDYVLRPQTPHWKIISTCIYEAQQLPVAPDAILIAIQGQATKDPQLRALLDEHRGMIPIGRYHDRFDMSENTCPLPVYIVDQGNITEYALRVLRYYQQPHAKKLTLKALEKSPRITLP